MLAMKNMALMKQENFLNRSLVIIGQKFIQDLNQKFQLRCSKSFLQTEDK